MDGTADAARGGLDVLDRYAVGHVLRPMRVKTRLRLLAGMA
jgi:hypothetical protein